MIRAVKNCAASCMYYVVITQINTQENMTEHHVLMKRRALTYTICMGVQVMCGELFAVFLLTVILC